jgi:hypothetical protein
VTERLRAVLLGLVAGVVPLLLLDLAATLQDAILRDPGSTSVWWPVACWFGVGVVAAAGVAAGRRDRVIPAVALAVVGVTGLALVMSPATDWVRALPLLPTPALPVAVVFTLAGLYAFSVLRGPSS